MGSKLPERPKWLEHALQGLAFWIGHRQSFFNSYPLAEGALVAEACNLIQANRPNDLVLLPERMYQNLVPTGTTLKGVTGQSRADLVLCDKLPRSIGRDENISPHVRFVIEVKRGSAPKREIDSDLVKLHSYLRASSNGARAFLFVISESSAHRRFVNDGKSILGMQDIPNCGGHFRVRRTVKAAASFSGKKTAHYVCLIEVFEHSRKRAKPI